MNAYLGRKKWRQQCIKLLTGSFFFGRPSIGAGTLGYPALISSSKFPVLTGTFPIFFGPVVVQELWAIQPSSPLQNFQFWLAHSLFFWGPVVVQELWAIQPSSPLQNFQFWLVHSLHSLFFWGPVVVQELWATQPSSPLQNFQFWLVHSLFFWGPVVVQELWATQPSSPLQISSSDWYIPYFFGAQ